MPLASGARLGPYEIVGPLGAGGMGEVYEARDTRLERRVAVKVLPEAMFEDQDSLARFEREAKAVAALSHPNIVGIHDYGREGNVVYAVTELLDGETLRELLRGGPLPLSKAVEYARQIAEGLGAAHDKGVVHRDLKPENAFVTRDGRVKILDFGMAKLAAAEAFGEPVDERASTELLSQPGAIFGTVQYMAPEQLRGRTADARSDIFSLGVILYETMAGERPFQGESAADIMSGILRQDPPPIVRQGRPVPAALEQILRRCLEKRPEERFRSARDLAFALVAVGSLTTGPLPPVATVGPARWRTGAIAVAVLLALAGAFLLGRWSARRQTPAGRVLAGATFLQLTDYPGVEKEPDLAPDGKSLLYVGNAAGNEDIYLQRVGGRNPLNLTADSPVSDTAPAFSPEGELIAFRSERDGGGIFLMGATGESVRRLTDFGYDPDWSPDGEQIAVSTEAVDDPLFRKTTSELWIVTVRDGQRRRLDVGDAVGPSWSPGGGRIAYWSTPSATGQRDILTVPVAGGEPTAVTDDPEVDWNPVWSPDGRHLYFSSSRGGSMNLWRVGIEEASGRVLGKPESLTAPARWIGGITFSGDGGLLGFASLDQRSTLYRTELDPAGAATVGRAVPILRGSREIRNIDLSPDGSLVAFSSGGLREDLFVVGADGSGYRQLTDDEARDRGPQWSPDGQQIAFYSNRGGRYEIWTIQADGSGLSQLTAVSGSSAWFPTWSPDGGLLALVDGERTWVVEVGGSRPRKVVRHLPTMAGPVRFLATSWSPDGDRLAGLGYKEDGSFADGLFVYDFEDSRYTAVAETGTYPLWLAGGDRLLFWQAGGISLLDVATGRSWPLLPGVLPVGQWREFSVAADDRRLVFVERVHEGDVWLLNLAPEEAEGEGTASG